MISREFWKKKTFNFSILEKSQVSPYGFKVKNHPSQNPKIFSKVQMLISCRMPPSKVPKYDQHRHNNKTKSNPSIWDTLYMNFAFLQSIKLSAKTLISKEHMRNCKCNFTQLYNSYLETIAKIKVFRQLQLIVVLCVYVQM